MDKCNEMGVKTFQYLIRIGDFVPLNAQENIIKIPRNTNQGSKLI